MTWVLVVLIGSLGHGKVSVVVPGFRSETACAEAGAAIDRQWDSMLSPVAWSCLKVPP